MHCASDDTASRREISEEMRGNMSQLDGGCRFAIGADCTDGSRISDAYVGFSPVALEQICFGHPEPIIRSNTYNERAMQAS